MKFLSFLIISFTAAFSVADSIPKIQSTYGLKAYKCSIQGLSEVDKKNSNEKLTFQRPIGTTYAKSLAEAYQWALNKLVIFTFEDSNSEGGLEHYSKEMTDGGFRSTVTDVKCKEGSNFAVP